MPKRIEWTYDALLERSFPEPNTGCYIWSGVVNNKGYGEVSFFGEMHYAHRAAWILVNGEIPAGMCVLHSCDLPSCINVMHLSLGTQLQNMQDCARRGRGGRFSRSKHGFPYGVYVVGKNRKRPYQARIHINKKDICLGYFESAEAAGAAAICARNRLLLRT